MIGEKEPGAAPREAGVPAPGRGSAFSFAIERAEPDSAAEEHVLDPSRSLIPLNLAPPGVTATERLIRLAYRIGVPARLLAFGREDAGALRLLGTVDSPLPGDHAAGEALRSGHFLVHGLKAPIAQMDYATGTRLSPPFERVIHGYGWLRDLASGATRDQAAPVAERIHAAWLDANPQPGKGQAWDVELVGHRVLAWLVHAPLIMGGDRLRNRTLAALEDTARWLDRRTGQAADRLGEAVAWAAIAAAGVLMSGGNPRRLYGEAGLADALGELVAEDGGVLSRSPVAQMDAIALLVDLAACYRAAGREPPETLAAMQLLLVPPLLTLMHGEAGLGSWQGAPAVPADTVGALVRASGVRTRPLNNVRHWGYQRVAARDSVLQFDAAPPPLARHARHGCASTLAFEFSHAGERIIVNCGGAATGGGQVPARIEQGLRGTAAHSTLTLDDANSTAILLKGQIGSGVAEVEIDRRMVDTGRGGATRLEAAHDGYAARYGLLHRRILLLRDDGTELLGEDILLPQGKRGKRGKIGYAIRFHCGPQVEVALAQDGLGATLALEDGQRWQFRLAGGNDGELQIDESLWVDGRGRPRPTQQLVIQGMTSRSGGNFSWLLKKMG